MPDKAPDDAPPKITIRNTTRSSLSIHVPGECIRLQPGQSAEVHKAYLETAELRTLHQQGAVASMEPPSPARETAADDTSTEGESESTRRAGPRKR